MIDHHQPVSQNQETNASENALVQGTVPALPKVLSDDSTKILQKIFSVGSSSDQTLTKEQEKFINENGFCSSERTSLSLLTRIVNFAKNLPKLGVIYATAEYLMSASKPLNPERIWTLWNMPVPDFLLKLAIKYPREEKRQEVFAKLMKVTHEISVISHYEPKLKQVKGKNIEVMVKQWTRFWELVLGKYGFYSPMLLDKPDINLSAANNKKGAEIISLMGLGSEKDRTILEMGCGWGSMLWQLMKFKQEPTSIYAATISPQQIEYLKNQKEFYGISIGNVDCITTILPKESFDNIVSMGIVEHTRPSEIEGAFRNWSEALKPGGNIVLEFFASNDTKLHHLGDSEKFPVAVILAQLLFPGSAVVSKEKYVKAWEKAGLIAEIDQELPSNYYITTFRAWLNNIINAKEEILKMDGGVGLFNGWLNYLAFGAAVFRHELFKTYRVRLVKRGG
jgi:cyclopropane-fatty-acyl-phospholipid synthase